MVERAPPTSAEGEVPAGNQLATVLPFTFEGNEVRVVDRDGGLWFFLADACKVLGIKNPSDAASRLDDDEKSTLGKAESGKINGLGSVGAMPTLISEPGFYKLVGRSNKPVAKRFDRWVRHEVLPSIRRTGGYMMVSPQETEEELILRAVNVLRDTVARQQAQIGTLESTVAEAMPKVLAWERIADAEGLITISNAARGMNVGQKALFIFLEHKVCWIFRERSKRDDRLVLPMAGPRGKGWMVVRRREYERKDGKKGTSQQTYLTMAGYTKLTELAIQRGLIKPPETAKGDGG